MNQLLQAALISIDSLDTRDFFETGFACFGFYDRLSSFDVKNAYISRSLTAVDPSWISVTQIKFLGN